MPLSLYPLLSYNWANPIDSALGDNSIFAENLKFSFLVLKAIVSIFVLDYFDHLKETERVDVAVMTCEMESVKGFVYIESVFDLLAGFIIEIVPG